MSAIRKAEARPPAPARREFHAMLESSAAKIAATLPQGMSAERFVRIASVAYAADPDLAKCEPTSVLIAVMQAAELGLEVGKPLNLCYLIGYWNKDKGIQECQLQLDYRGWLELAYRTGLYVAIDARVVHARDHFAVAYDPALSFAHVPSLDADPGPVTHAYAWARLKDGTDLVEVMTAAEIDGIRQGSRGKDSPAWRNHRGEMQKKTVLKRFLKRRPRTVHLAQAALIDDAGHDFELGTSRPRPLPSLLGPQETRTALLKRQLAETLAPAPQGPPEPEDESQELPEPAPVDREPGQEG